MCGVFRTCLMSRSLSVLLPGFLVILLGGCADLRGSTRDWGARLLGREAVPTEVGGVPLDGLAALGVDGAAGCRDLVVAQQRQQYVPSTQLRGDWLPACEQAVADARAHAQWLLEADRLMADAWQALEQEQQARAEREARQQALEQAIRDRQHAADDQARQVERDQRVASLQEALAKARIHTALRAFQDKPMAYTLADMSARSMKEFLGCIELAYPNKGYEVSFSGHVLTVKALKASSLRGNVTIEARFYETGKAWLLNYLRVAEMEAPSAQDRFILAQNLMASHCYAIDGRL